MSRDHLFGRSFAAKTRARPAIPRIVGILMLVFGGIALLGGTFGVIGCVVMPRGLVTVLLVSNLAGVGIAALEVAAGVALVRYRRTGIALARAYAIANITATVAYAIVAFAWVNPAMARAGFGELTTPVLTAALSALSLAWPVVVLALLARPAARAACTAG